jgi:ribonuclease J
MALQAERPPGIYWQSRMGNNADGIGGNCHSYEIVTAGPDGGLADQRILVDMGIKLGGGGHGYACEFASPNGILARHDTGQVTGGARAPEALFLTHAHEDHLGAVHHAIDMGFDIPPVYASPFTAMSLANSLGNAGIDRGRWPPINIVKAGDKVNVANAEVEFVAMDHMPGASALRIRTSEATVFHTGDYKFDDTLLLGDRADPRRLRQIGRDGVDIVVSDSTSAGVSGERVSEDEIRRHLTDLVADNEGRAIVAGILGSQLDRLASLGQAAEANGRSLVVSGGSLAQNVQTLTRSGVDLEAVTGARILTPQQARDLPAHQVLVATTGAFAQPNAGLTRAAERLPGALCIDNETTVIIPQRAIPNVQGPRAAMIAKLERQGAQVVTAERAVDMGYGPIHQTGHAIQGDVKLLYALVRPKLVVAPMHGDAAQVEANARVAESLGIASLPLEENGALVRINHQAVEVVGHQEIRRIGASDRQGEVKALPRAARGEGRHSRFPPAVYRYDELDPQGRKVLAGNVYPVDTPTRPHANPPVAAKRFAGSAHRHHR